MLKKTALIIILISVIYVNGGAQAAGNFLYNNPYSINGDRATVPVNSTIGNMINLKAEVMMNVRATSYTAIFSASQAGSDAVEVDSLMNQRLNQIKYALGMLGISEDDIHIDAVSMVPTYAYKIEEKKFSKRSIEIPTGFEMKKNIHILFLQHALLDKIISEMAFAEIYDMVKIEYNIDGLQSYHEELRRNALEIIQSKASMYHAMQLHLDISGMADGFSCTYPMERYKSYTAYNSGSTPVAVSYARQNKNNNIIMNGHTNNLNLQASKNDDQLFLVQTAEKNKTIFYDRMPYNQFDKVLNADIEEPCIQVFYSLQSTYSLITEKQFQEEQERIAASKKMNKSKRGMRRSGR